MPAVAVNTLPRLRLTFTLSATTSISLLVPLVTFLNPKSPSTCTNPAKSAANPFTEKLTTPALTASGALIPSTVNPPATFTSVAPTSPL